jgi:DNA-binding MarR family transcriptional regulator
VTPATGTPARTTPPTGPRPRIGTLCFLISKDWRTALDRDLAQFGLRAQQAAALVQCRRQRGANPSRLASLLGTDAAGATGLIDQLEEKGLARRRRDPSDRRAVIVEPTRAGAALLPRLRQVFQNLHRQLLAGFSKDEASCLEGMLERLHVDLANQIRIQATGMEGA